MILITIGVGVVHTTAKYSLRMATDNMTNNLRSKTFSSIIKQPIEFFDNKDNSTSNLASVLSVQMQRINGASVDNYVRLLQGLVAHLTGLIIGYIFSWKIGVFMTAISPVV